MVKGLVDDAALTTPYIRGFTAYSTRTRANVRGEAEADVTGDLGQGILLEGSTYAAFVGEAEHKLAELGLQ